VITEKKADQRRNFGERWLMAQRRLLRQRHRFSGTALAREGRYVRRGIRAYNASVSSGPDLYLLRRNVHRIEKGLTMRPVRSQFAVDYIAETVNAFHDAVRAGVFPPDHPEFTWIYSVLSGYFEATSSSTHPTIASSRQQYSLAVESVGPLLAVYGPHHPIPFTPTVKIDDLEELAVNRRSIRWFTRETVNRELVDRAIKIAAESPTACNRQPYRFEIFDDPESTAKVAAIPMGTQGYQHQHQIPGLIVIIGNLAAFFDKRDRHLIYIDGSLAAMGLVYGLESQGVNTCCINWPDIPIREVKMRELLGLKPYERVVMLLAYGYADPEALVTYSGKRSIDEIRDFRTL
jgi:nitroreductase